MLMAESGRSKTGVKSGDTETYSPNGYNINM